VFGAVLDGRPSQFEHNAEEVAVTAAALCDFAVPGGKVTDAGVRANVSVGTRYLDAWLDGVGAAAIDHLMEDVATAEISRAQVWSWVRAGLVEAETVRAEIAAAPVSDAAKEVFEEVALADELVEFLTLPAYDRLP
jgi:malate synthase